MRHTYILFLALFLSFFALGQSEIRIVTEGVTATADIWVDISTAPNGGGSVIWTQKTDSCAGLGLVDTTITIPSGTYYVNCYDQKGDGWTDTIIGIFAYNLQLGSADSPNDGVDIDATDSCDNTTDEIEASFEIVVPEPISCPIVLNLETTDITDTKAILSWINGSTEGQWEYVVQPAGLGEPTTNGTVIDTNPYVISDLSPLTAYEVYLRADCGSNDYSDWVGPKTFNTTAIPINTFPYLEDFETGSGGWIPDNYFSTNTGDYWRLTTPSYGNINTAASGQYTWVTIGNGPYSQVDDAYVMSPPLDFTSLEAPIIEFAIWWDCLFSQDGMTLQSSVDNGNTWQTVGGFNQPIGGISNWYTDDSIDALPGGQGLGWTGSDLNGSPPDNTSSNGYVMAKNYLSGLAGESQVYLRFVFSAIANPPDASGVAFDDIMIYDAPCDPVTGLTVDALDTTATISWTAGGVESQWEVAVQNTGAGLPSAGTSVSSIPYTATGLETSTTYEVYVKADCGIDGTSDWVGPVNFTTNELTLYDADFSNDGDGFPDHTTISPPAPEPASVGPFGSAPNSWFLSYNSQPSTDSGGNTFKVDGGALVSTDWGGQGIFTSQVIDISGVDFVNIEALTTNTGANDNQFKYFYILDGGIRIETEVGVTTNGDPLNYTISALDVSSHNTLTVGFEFSENGNGEGYTTTQYIVTVPAATSNTLVEFTNSSSSIAEGVGTIDLTFSITNPDPTNATSFDLELTTGDNADVNGYTTQTVTFPAGSSADETVTITVTDDAVFEGDETLTFTIVGVTGGNNATLGTQSTFDLTIEDNESSPGFAFWHEPFDNNNLYTVTLGGEGNDGSQDYFQITDGSNINQSYTGIDGTFHASQDIDDGGWANSAAPSQLTWMGIDVSEFTSLSFKGSFASNGGGIDDSDFVLIEYQIDNGGWLSLLAFENTGGFNNNFFEDTDFDGTGDGLQLTSTFQEFEKSIPVGSTLDLRITVYVDSGGEDLAFDNFKVEGIYDGYAYSDGSWYPANPDGTTGASNAIVADGVATLSSDINLNDVVVNPGAGLVVETGNTLTVNSLTLESTSSSFSSLINNGTIIGTTIYNRYTDEVGTGATGTGGNDLIALPLFPSGGLTFDTFLTQGSPANSTKLASQTTVATTYAFGPYNNNSPVPAYENYDSNSTDALVVAKGYRAATTTGETLTFEGDVLQANQTIGLTNPVAGGSQWNLIGNPFASYVDAQAWLSTNGANLDPAAVAIYGYNSGTYSGSGDTISNFTIINGTSNTALNIAPGQAFFVAADTGDAFGDAGTVIFAGNDGFPADMRTSTGSDDFIEGRNSTNYHLKIKLDGTTSATTSFYFNDNSTRGLDPGFDAATLDAFTSEHLLYSHLVEDNTGRSMAINSLAIEDMSDVTIPLGVNSNQGEEITFSIDTSTLPDGINVYLDDNVANMSTLLNSGNYILTPTTDLSGTGRFYLRIGDSSLSVPNAFMDQLKIYTNNTEKAIVISGELPEASVAHVYDLQGRQVVQRSLNTTMRTQSINVGHLSTGVYIVKVGNGSQHKSQKVILN